VPSLACGIECDQNGSMVGHGRPPSSRASSRRATSTQATNSAHTNEEDVDKPVAHLTMLKGDNSEDVDDVKNGNGDPVYLVVTSESGEEISDESDDELLEESDQELEPVKPVARMHQPKPRSKTAVRKPVKKPEEQSKGKRDAAPKYTQDDAESEDDPATCSESILDPNAIVVLIYEAFNIASAIKHPDGSYAPFTVSSTVSFDELHIAIAKKIRGLAGLIRLQYRLDSDKPKACAMSIRSDEELDLFKERMRGLIVPQKLASGKVSTRVLKPVRVNFEDVGEQAASAPTTATTASGKKVCHKSYMHRPTV
jgi:hypothetical protein